MDFWALTVTSLGTLLAFMTIVWAISVPLRNASIVDIVWGPAFVLVAAVGLALGEGSFPRRLLLMVLVGIWGIRLAVHIFRRNLGKGEDARYQAFREKYGADRYWWFSLFQVFWLQAILAWTVSIPLQLAAAGSTPERLTLVDGLGVVLWVVGFTFEAVGDVQLDRFKGDPANRGRVMDRGLWRYTRHPNYFGDATLWWGYGLIALLVPWGWAGLVGPAVMTFLLLRVSGVTMLEKDIEERRPGYREYVRRTSAFLPLPPREA
jgi:steroid 5-alpha reductase family enzyme